MPASNLPITPVERRVHGDDAAWERVVALSKLEYDRIMDLYRHRLNQPVIRLIIEIDE